MNNLAERLEAVRADISTAHEGLYQLEAFAVEQQRALGLPFQAPAFSKVKPSLSAVNAAYCELKAIIEELKSDG
jgi:hypothetical protein